MSKIYRAIKFVAWRPLNLFMAGAVISTLLTFNGPSNVSLVLLSPAIAIVSLVRDLREANDCNDQYLPK